jgi:hypothetical protein
MVWVIISLGPSGIFSANKHSEENKNETAIATNRIGNCMSGILNEIKIFEIILSPFPPFFQIICFRWGELLFSNLKIQVYLCTMSKLNRYISFLLLVCFLPVVTPKEFIHDLFGHEDTQDHYHSAVTIEKIHKHCSILQISFSIFISFLKSFFLKKEIDNCAYSFPQQTYIPGISVNLSYLRAPPTYHI